MCFVVSQGEKVCCHPNFTPMCVKFRMAELLIPKQCSPSFGIFFQKIRSAQLCAGQSSSAAPNLIFSMDLALCTRDIVKLRRRRRGPFFNFFCFIFWHQATLELIKLLIQSLKHTKLKTIVLYCGNTCPVLKTMNEKNECFSTHLFRFFIWSSGDASEHVFFFFLKYLQCVPN